MTDEMRKNVRMSLRIGETKWSSVIRHQCIGLFLITGLPVLGTAGIKTRMEGSEPGVRHFSALRLSGITKRNQSSHSLLC